MKKTIFANWGHAKQGKSDTVKRITKKILAHYPRATTEPIRFEYKGDIQVVITIGKTKIGIESQGDPNSRLLVSLKKFSNEDCNIIVCSTRTSGQTVEEVDKLNTSHGYEIVWVTNYRSKHKNQDELNDISASHIFEHIQKTLLSEI